MQAWAVRVLPLACHMLAEADEQGSIVSGSHKQLDGRVVARPGGKEQGKKWPLTA